MVPPKDGLAHLASPYITLDNTLKNKKESIKGIVSC
jgi:hypothetical protein